MFKTVRYSGYDGNQCCLNGCGFEESIWQEMGEYEFEWCMCQPCPICDKRVPEWVLYSKKQYTPNGVWVGPHCVNCDFQMFLH